MKDLIKTIKTYYNLTKPGIVYGNLLTTAAGYLLASRWQIDWVEFLAILAGTALVIASACVFNNYIDRGIDAKMARTKKRALVTTKINTTSALSFASMLGLLGFAILLMGTNLLTALVGLTGYIFYIIIYAVAKRKTVYGTMIGSVAGAIPPLAGYTAYSSTIDKGGIIFFLILTLWQMPHFYAIAMYRYKDYKAAGLPVWPVARGMQSTKSQIMLFIAAFIAACTALTIYGYTGYIYLAVMLTFGLIWLYKGLKGFKAVEDVKWARQMFGFSLIVMMTLSVMVPLGTLLP